MHKQLSERKFVDIQNSLKFVGHILLINGEFENEKHPMSKNFPTAPTKGCFGYQRQNGTGSLPFHVDRWEGVLGREGKLAIELAVGPDTPWPWVLPGSRVKKLGSLCKIYSLKWTLSNFAGARMAYFCGLGP